jgi:diguanylate cyclase (GGDEF)-like protein
MPECTGLELAQVIRQMETYLSIPIVYLSSETDRDKQLEAVGLGGDDFLEKPIKPSHLVAAVTSRIERYRKLRALMLHDSLTGLFNHTTTKERLAQEIARAKRFNFTFSFALLDLDLFKSVNDTHGHLAGDRVLKSLSQLLMRRLRSLDTVGRYGGEEFAVILPNTSLETAVTVMDEIRMGFEHIHHHSGENEFAVTFSCGVAQFPDCQSVGDLIDTADKALYDAKHQGRNAVCSRNC